MKNRVLRILGIIALLTTAALVLKEEDVQLITQDLDFNGNVVINNTGIPAYDTILSHSLTQLNVSGSEIIITALTDDVNVEGLGNVKGAVGLRKDGRLILYITKMSTRDALTVIPHEAVHIKQHHEKTLIPLSNTSAIYKGKVYGLTSTDYDERPWEIEAFDEGYKLTKKLRKSIVKK